VPSAAHRTFATASSYAELNAVLERARSDLGHTAPLTDSQLLGLQHRWSTALCARLDEAIEVANFGEEREVVAAAWHTLARDLDILRMVLDTHEAVSPVLTDAQGAEFRMLALAARLASLDTPTTRAVELGRRFRAWIRSRTEVSDVRAKEHPRAASPRGSSFAEAGHDRGAGQRHGALPVATNDSATPEGPRDGHPGAVRNAGCRWVTAWRTRCRVPSKGERGERLHAM
jgi:hypothetical protein